MKKKNIFIFFLIIVLTACAYFVSFQGLKIGNFEMKSVRDQLKLGLDIKGGVVVVYEAKTDGNMDTAINQTINILSRRINQLGLTEPIITKQGDNRIRIELPGVENATEAVKVIGMTAQLEFLLVKPESFAAAGMKKTEFEHESVMTGENVSDAYLSQNSYGNPAVGLSFDGVGAEAFRKATQKAKELEAAYGRPIQIAIVLDGEVISAPVVNSVVPDGKGIIDGGFTIETANNLALLIRGGALPVVLEEAYISEIGPTLGLDAFNSAVKAALVGLIAVAIYMLITYKYPGFIASVALGIYALIIIYGMLLFGATLTLPGIAGIVISFGMAVDANVIIFERIKEELANQKSIRASISSGFKRAMSTVVDSNTTTFIAALVLFYFGDGPIKGFAVTLMLGIAASMITAVLITHYLLDLSVGFIKTPAMYGSKEQKTKNFSFLGRYKLWFAASLAVVLGGLGVFAVKQFNYGIDFTGGTMIQIGLHQKVDRDAVVKDIESFRLKPQVVHAGANSEQIIIKTTEKLDTNNRFKVFEIFKNKYALQDSDLISSEQISASVSKDIKVSAIWSILIASVLMLLYITFRFEFVFGLGAIISLAHDVLVLLAVYAIFRLPVNSSLIASVLTVVGYSINDTIVVYDRIREDVKRERTKSLLELANRSVNRTMSRTLNTTITTLVVIISLYIFGSGTIREFALPLFIGILVGTYSSIFIASASWALIRQRLVGKGKYGAK